MRGKRSPAPRREPRATFGAAVVTMALLAGVEEQHVYEAGERLLTDAQLYHAMAHAINPYGDGHTSEKIAQIILDWGRARRKRP